GIAVAPAAVDLHRPAKAWIVIGPAGTGLRYVAVRRERPQRRAGCISGDAGNLPAANHRSQDLARRVELTSFAEGEVVSKESIPDVWCISGREIFLANVRAAETVDGAERFAEGVVHIEGQSFRQTLLQRCLHCLIVRLTVVVVGRADTVVLRPGLEH